MNRMTAFSLRPPELLCMTKVKLYYAFRKRKKLSNFSEIVGRFNAN